MDKIREFHNEDIILFVNLNDINKKPMRVFFTVFNMINKPSMKRQNLCLAKELKCNEAIVRA